MANAVFQCPNCGAQIDMESNELAIRLNQLKTRYAKLMQEREKLMQKHIDDKDFEYKIKHSRIKTELTLVEHTIRCLQHELAGKPVELWQLRYNKALEIAKTMMGSKTYEKFKYELDRACAPK